MNWELDSCDALWRHMVCLGLFASMFHLVVLKRSISWIFSLRQQFEDLPSSSACISFTWSSHAVRGPLFYPEWFSIVGSLLS